MRYVLDTTAVSSLMRRDEGAKRRLASVNPGDVAIPQPVVAEIEYGIARLRPSRRRQALREQLDLLCMAIPRLDWSDEVSVHFGLVKATLEGDGERIEDFDVAIAAHALASNATLVTSNGAHMRRVRGLLVEDWSSGT